MLLRLQRFDLCAPPSASAPRFVTAASFVVIEKKKLVA